MFSQNYSFSSNSDGDFISFQVKRAVLWILSFCSPFGITAKTYIKQQVLFMEFTWVIVLYWALILIFETEILRDKCLCTPSAKMYRGSKELESGADFLSSTLYSVDRKNILPKRALRGSEFQTLFVLSFRLHRSHSQQEQKAWLTYQERATAATLLDKSYWHNFPSKSLWSLHKGHWMWFWKVIYQEVLKQQHIWHINLKNGWKTCSSN